jgi:predicted AAA+ superfamily ATPase
MSLATAILESEREGEVLILKPAADLHDLEEWQIEEAAGELLELMGRTDAKDVVLDLHGTDPFQAPRLAAELWQRVRGRVGSLAIGFF